MTVGCDGSPRCRRLRGSQTSGLGLRCEQHRLSPSCELRGRSTLGGGSEKTASSLGA